MAANRANEQGNQPLNMREAEAELKNLLIDLVKENPLIYDKSHPLHYRTNARNEVWDKIGKILGIPGECISNILHCTVNFRNSTTTQKSR